MRGITVRFGDDMYELLKVEAGLSGVGLTAYIREAALARAVIGRAQRGHYEHNQELHEAVGRWLESEAGLNGGERV
jgi:hypothetical protein